MIVSCIDMVTLSPITGTPHLNLNHFLSPYYLLGILLLRTKLVLPYHLRPPFQKGILVNPSTTPIQPAEVLHYEQNTRGST